MGEKVTLGDNGTLSLTASALYNRLPLISADDCYTWSVAGNTIAAVDEEGNVEVGTLTGDCVLTVTAGETSATLNIRVDGSDFFLDTLTHWSREYVNALYKSGVLTGNSTPEGLLYRPDNNMTRAEFAAVVSRWLLLDPAAYAHVELPFADVNQIPQWAIPYVKCVYGEGIVKGNQSNGVLKFNPNSTITREEAMTIIGRTVEINENSPELTFSDSSKVSNWALPYVKTMVEVGVISGSGNKLTPKNPVTRSQVAKIIYTMDTVEFDFPEEIPEVVPDPEVTPETGTEAPEISDDPEGAEATDPEGTEGTVVNPVPGIIPDGENGSIPGMPEGL
ncbi:MAG: S-layer homology domain-containing protein [Firmicutes bacterium]|nr:S-layer homology domain-containing protein [Bacillota bacterium]